MKADAASGTVPSKHTKADFQNRGRVQTVGPPAGAFHYGALTLDLPSGPRFSPEATRRAAARGKPPTQTAPSGSSASRRAAVRAQMQRSDLPSEHSADLELAGTASPAAACEVWICAPAHPLAARAGRALRMPSTCVGRERAARPRANSTLRVLPAAKWRSIWSTPALEENRRVGPSGRERGGRKGGKARCPVIKAVIKAGPWLPAADEFPEVP